VDGTASRSPAPDEQAIYVYAFVDATQDAPHRPDAQGLLSLHRVGSINAIICQVPLADFCGPEAERNLEDPAWLLPRIRYHESVVESAMAWSPVFPARFATLFASVASLTDFMRRHETAIARFLEQVTGQQEWTLRLTAALDDLATHDDLAVELWPDWSGYSLGKRYLRLREERPRLLRLAGERVAQLVPAILDGLRPLVTAIRPLGSVEPPGSGAQYIEKHAILVSVSQLAALHDRAGELAAEQKNQRLQIALSGPWPPYSFRPALDE
jgi:hypothetical protein